MISRKTVVAMACLAAMAGSQAHAAPLTIDQIIMLTQTGIGDEAVIAKIRNTDTHMDLSVDQMLELKKKGVSSPVLAALLDTGAHAPATPQFSLTSADPAVPHPAGVYILDSAHAQMTRIDPTATSQSKTGGIFGYALTGGLASASIKASIQNASARIHSANPRPTFYFFFDESNPQAAAASSSWASGTAAVVTSPNEFSLVRLTAKSGRREARVGSINIAGAKTGVMDKDRIPFDYQLVRPGVYKIVPTADLAPGEYGFLFALNGNGAGGALNARIFDFSI
ncbi:MAG: hypothetical protein OC190_02545 [Novosphingobium aromaticivorans]|nr:hypothetical protein [Novosphingobium aromaticivorans]